MGPKSVIKSLASAGSFLDGGGSKPLQRAAISLLDDDHVRAEAAAISRACYEKRALLIERLKSLGVRIELEPQATFYVWGDLWSLPTPLK